MNLSIACYMNNIKLYAFKFFNSIHSFLSNFSLLIKCKRKKLTNSHKGIDNSCQKNEE